MCTGVESRSELLSGATCYFHNYADPSLPESAKAAAKKELGAIVAAHGGIVVAAPTPEVCSPCRQQRTCLVVVTASSS